MKALKIAGIIVLAIVVILGVIIAIQPAEGHVEKSTVINAPPPVVFAQLNSFKTFTKWAAWAKMDPEAKYSYEGPESGVGTKMNWDGRKIGRGSQWIVESEENKRVKSGLSFEGFDGTSYAEFNLAPEGSGTKVTWSYTGQNSGIKGKAIWVMMQPALATQYEQGLSDLKSMIESMPPAPADTMKVK